MTNPSAPIGVLDSGIGGFSVMAKLQELLPNEDIVYFGDNAHCPYGSRTSENVTELTQKIVDFLVAKGVKAIVIACNTISTQAKNLDNRGIPIIEIIGPVCRSFSIATPRSVGIVATPLTTKSKVYEMKLKEENHFIEPVGVAAPHLAALIEKGDFETAEIDDELKEAMQPLLDKNVKYVIWGCTHYPLVAKKFRYLFPGITFYDPAVFQAEELTNVLTSYRMPNLQEKHGSFTLYTSGPSQSAVAAIERLKLPKPDKIIENVLL